METSDRMILRICFFGHFGTENFGNEITLQTVLCHLRRLPNRSDAVCVCTYPEILAGRQKIETIPIKSMIGQQPTVKNRAVRLFQKMFIGTPREVYRWFDAFKVLKGRDMFIIPGTGLLTDAFGLQQWGPYNLFKWTSMAKLRRCKICFVSVGVGPLYSTLGKYFVKAALSLADFRSYRDNASLEYLKRIGFKTNGDRVFPDLVFSMSKGLIPDHNNKQGKRPVIGIGLMEYAGRYSVAEPSVTIYREYLESLVGFVRWLFAHDYDVRLLIGDGYDRPVVESFKSLLSTRLGWYDEKRIIDEPISSAEQLLLQIAPTDIVVATRFHNVLLALLLNKPVIAISFHHKCTSLMSEMGLAEYCHDINHMSIDRLIEQFQNLERNAEKLKPLVRQKVEQARKALDEQYNIIFKDI